MSERRRQPKFAVTTDTNGDQVVTAHAVIYESLSASLMNGDFNPGDRLVVRELAERFNTSAMPVREALRKLVTDGALYDHPNRGVLVPAIDIAAVADLVRVRCAIEGTAAEWAATTISQAELDAVYRANEMMQTCIDIQQVGDYLRFNTKFHFTIYRAARSESLNTIIERLWLRAGPLLNVMRQEATIKPGFDHHAEIMEALKTGDGSRARRAVVDDISFAGDIIQRAAPYWRPASPVGAGRPVGRRVPEE
ncbi:GntR family transcriptional regulator [Aestuariivirga sp.]|uniref:GntR family transcriptional regulator n=1 Tax=Aestuariivirga sp. TaxID=2650926 RepID=UPI003BA9BB9C